MKKSKGISKLAAVILFIAFIRTVAKPLRLQYYSEEHNNLLKLYPCTCSALVTSKSSAC